MIKLELINNVVAWARERELLKEENMTAQFLKVCEEVSEYFSANDRYETEDAIGDIMVTLIVLVKQTGEEVSLDYDLFSDYRKKQNYSVFSVLAFIGSELLKRDNKKVAFRACQMLTLMLAEFGERYCNDCLSSAYEVIKNRKGKTINGTFIKD